MLLHQPNNLIKGLISGLVGSHQVSDELLRPLSTDTQQDSMLLLGTFHIIRQKILLQTLTVRSPVFGTAVEWANYAIEGHRGFSSSPIVVC